MPIDTVQLLADILFWLPDSNVLTDSQINTIAQYIINDVGDDDSNYAEVLCKSLRACGLANLSKHTVDGAALKQEKVGENSETYSTAAMQNIWDNFLDSLKDICPIFGYTGLSTNMGMKINPSTTPVVNDCPDESDLFL